MHIHNPLDQYGGPLSNEERKESIWKALDDEARVGPPSIPEKIRAAFKAKMLAQRAVKAWEEQVARTDRDSEFFQAHVSTLNAFKRAAE